MKNKVIFHTLLLIFLGLVGCATQQQKVDQYKPLPESMKGYELYSWKNTEIWNYKLLTGTNRNKTLGEIISTETTITDDGWVNYYIINDNILQIILQRLPGNTFLSWNPSGINTGNIESTIRFEYPDNEIKQYIRQICQEKGIQLLMN